jgi:glycosyltransferase involved in cell wall biosynthesis
MSASRPAVSVVVPFAGDLRAAERTVVSLRQLELGEDDQLIVADNSADQVMAALAPDGIQVSPATLERSSYHARNTGVALAGGDWLLFMDADCEPDPELLDAYFEPPVPQECGALAGQIDGDPQQTSFLAGYTRSRKFFRQDAGFLAEAGTAATGNLMVRRAAFAEIGGFTESIRSGGDVDLCRRLWLAGWTIEPRIGAVVRHRHRDSLPSLLGAIARYGAGSRWLNERYPGESGPWPLLSGLRGVAMDVPRCIFRGEVSEGAYRLVDGAGLIAHRVGYRMGNEAGRL